MGRNMQPYILIKKVLVTYIINFIIDWNCTYSPVLAFTAYVLTTLPVLYENRIFVSQRNKLLLRN